MARERRHGHLDSLAEADLPFTEDRVSILSLDGWVKTILGWFVFLTGFLAAGWLLTQAGRLVGIATSTPFSGFLGLSAPHAAASKPAETPPAAGSAVRMYGVGGSAA